MVDLGRNFQVFIRLFNWRVEGESASRAGDVDWSSTCGKGEYFFKAE